LRGCPGHRRHCRRRGHVSPGASRDRDRSDARAAQRVGRSPERLALLRPGTRVTTERSASLSGERTILCAMDAADRLRALHRTPPIFVIPNAWDAASARLFEAEGFPAIATTSAGVAASLGYADGGAVPAREMIEAISRIARAVKVPVSADIEHAYA